MPKRPREHQIESESRQAFEVALGSRFVFRGEHPDYGIDGDVEEFDIDGRATGVRFYVQLKGTDESNLVRALRASIALETASYYRSLQLPVLMVRFHAPTKRTFVRWFHQFDPYYGGLGTKTLSFRWAPSDELTRERREGLVPDVEAFHRFHSSSLPLPLTTHLQTLGAFGLTPAEIGFALRRAASQRPDIVDVKRDKAPAGAAYLTVANNEIAAHLGNVTSATLHIGSPYDPGRGAESLASDAMVMLALAFEHVGQADVAARLAATFFVGAVLRSSPPAAFALSSAMASSRRIIEGLQLAEQLDTSDDVDARGGSFVFTMPALFHGESLSSAERDAFRVTEAARIDRREARGDRAGAAGECVTLGNHLRASGEPALAIDLYEKAASLDARYRERPHWWFEYAGVLFGARRYGESAEAYLQAVRRGAEPIALALQADAAMFAGRYAEAYDLFVDFNRDHTERGDEYRLKQLAVAAVRERVGVEQQERQTQRASVLVDGLEDNAVAPRVAAAMLKALGHDALHGTAWTLLAATDAEQGDVEGALIAYIAGAVLSERDPVAWAFALDLAMGYAPPQVRDDVITCARRLGGDELLRYLPDVARDLDFDDDFLDSVEQAFGELPDERPRGFDLRFVNEQGSVETVHFGGDEPARTDGQRLPRRVEEQPGRNDPCWCGSGQKFKKCHGV